jgi:hypothetical protein
VLGARSTPVQRSRPPRSRPTDTGLVGRLPGDLLQVIVAEIYI